MADVRIGMEYTKLPDPNWVRDLEAASPRSDVHSWLWPVWYASGERWVLYEMVPRSAIPAEILDELEGPQPDSIPLLRRWKKGKWVVFRQTNITQRQWELYRDYRCWARPSIVVQGSRGGHLVVYGPEDQEAMQMVGLPSSPPAVGDLPYAPIDARTIRLVQEQSRLIRAGNDLHAMRQMFAGEGGKRTRQAALRMHREQYAAWLFNQVEEPAEHFVRAYQQDDLPAPRNQTAPDYERTLERATEQFVETGRLAS